MKYRLKKDLPFAKAGEIVNYKDLGGDAINIELNGLCCYIPNIVKGFWIEEVKPREWWVTEHRDHSAGIVRRISASKEEEPECIVTNCEQIKVREVL